MDACAINRGLRHAACTLTTASCRCELMCAVSILNKRYLQLSNVLKGFCFDECQSSGVGNVLCQIIARSRAFMNGYAPRHVYSCACTFLVHYSLKHRHKQKCRAGCCSRAGQSRSQTHLGLTDLQNCFVWNANGTRRSPWPTSELHSVAARCRATRPSVRARPRTCRVIASATATKTVKIGKP
jgi:hypothetical protein